MFVVAFFSALFLEFTKYNIIGHDINFLIIKIVIIFLVCYNQVEQNTIHLVVCNTIYFMFCSTLSYYRIFSFI